MQGANEVYLEYLLGAVTRNQIVGWAAKLLKSCDQLANDRNLISIAELESVNYSDWTIQPEDLLKEAVAMFYGDFRIPSVETEIYARACLRVKCADFLVGAIHRSELFSVVENIQRLFENPPWLGNLGVLSCKARKHAEGENFNQCLKNEVKARLTEL